MALIKCKECKKQISDKAASCPHCGYPLKEIKQEKKEESKDLIEKIKENKHLRKVLIRFGLSFILFLLIVIPLEYGINYKGSYPLIMMYSLTQNGAFFLYIIFGLIIFINFILNLISKKLKKVNMIIDVIALILLIAINSFIVFTSGIRLTFIVYPLMYLTMICLILLNLEKPFKDKKNKIFLIIIITIGLISSIIFATNKISIPLSKINNLNELKEGNKLFIKVDLESINVREKPDKSSKKIGSVEHGEEYEVLEIAETSSYRWYKIKDANNIEGYIANPKNNVPYLKFEEVDKNDYKITSLETFNDEIVEEEIIEDINEGKEKETTTKKTNKTNKTTKTTTNKVENKTNKTTKTTTKITTTQATTTQKITTSNKEECNKKIKERTVQYEKDVNNLDNKYSALEADAKNEMENAKELVDNYGGTISKSYYNSRKSSISSALSKAQQNYQRAALSNDYYGKARYEQEISDLTRESAELARRYELTEQYNDMTEIYKDLLEEHKYDLQQLYDKFSKELDSIEASCK